MICPNCGSEKKSKVLETRELEREAVDFVYRRRECVICGCRYMTEEHFIRKLPPKRHQKTPDDGVNDN